MVDSNTRQAKRTPVTLKVKFKSETLDQFIERYAVDVSQGGIFIRTKEPQPVGTQMKFEFQLRDGAPLIGGEGTVVWIREPDPSRPAVAPGMGVRFDRLAEGSPVVLERILNQKSRQSGGGGGGLRGLPSKTPSFNETPTRVAQMPMTDDEREHTPLPSPMPFHSDADEFPDEAFEEATKVRSVEDLIAQTAMSTSDLPLPAPPVSSPGIAPPPFQAPSGTPPFASPVPLRDSQEPTRTLLDASPPPPQVAARTLIDAAPPPAGRTLLDAAPPPPHVQASSPALTPPPVIVSSPGLVLPPLAEPRARALEPIGDARSRTATGAPQPQVASAPAAPVIGRTMQPRESKVALLAIAVVCALAAIAAVVWLVWLRKPATLNEPGKPSEPIAAQVAPAPTEVPPTPPVQAPPPAAELLETTIAVNANGASVEVVGSDQRGAAPLAAKLEKGKTYKAKVSAPGHIASEITVIGGNDQKVDVKLEPKPRVLEVNSTPGQATVYLDGVSTKRTTPASVDLSATQAGRKLRLMIRRVGYQPFFVTIKPEDFGEQTDRMLHTVNASLTSARAAPAPRATEDAPKDGGSPEPPAPPPAEPTPEPKPESAPPAEPTPALPQ